MSKPRMDKSRIAATAVFHGAAKMSKDERRQVAAWLRMLAHDIIKEGDRYAARMTARRYL